jgi:filamentous hemagglutinin family protein
MNNRIYVIVDSSEAVNFNFDQLVDIDESYSRKSLDGSKILARFEGDTPSFLDGKIQYTNAEILTILSGDEWTDTESQP